MSIFVMIYIIEAERPAIATVLAGLFNCGCKKGVMVIIQANVCGKRNQFVRLHQRLCHIFAMAKLLREVDKASNSNSTGRPFLWLYKGFLWSSKCPWKKKPICEVTPEAMSIFL
jgi:hypothetical protein